MLKRFLLPICLLVVLTSGSPCGYGFQDDGPPSESDTTSPATAGRTESQPEAGASEQSSPSLSDENADGTGFFEAVSSWLAPISEALKPADAAMEKVNGKFIAVIFHGVPLRPTDFGKDIWNLTAGNLGASTYELSDDPMSVPLAVLVLVLGAVFFTLRMAFINVRGFVHAIQVTSGKFDDPSHKGEVSHFQALMAALSATIGLGNIGGVAVAIASGGPGATVWMVLAGFLGMSSKFVECTLGQKYRRERPDGRIMGGAMYYLLRGIPELGLGIFGKALGGVLAVVFAVLCIGGSLAGGNSYQVSQSLGPIGHAIPWLDQEAHRWLYGLVMAILVGIVIIGGIRRIAKWAEKIVPTMCGVYVAAALVILIKNIDGIPDAITTIFRDAWTGEAVAGGTLGVIVMGFKRAAFSNEAGVGSAAIAHAAAKTDYPAREGMVALLGPFIDTIVICTMTALVITITGVWNDPQYAELVAKDEGAKLTSIAMDQQIPNFKYVLAVAASMFAFSTMISWSYYGERCWAFLFGDRSSMIYRLLFVVFTFLGAVISATNVLVFGDLMILGMAIPNVIGVVLLSGKVKRDLDVYWAKLKAGEFHRFK